MAPATILISYHLHMQDLSLALVPMLLLLERCVPTASSPPGCGNRGSRHVGAYLDRMAAEIAPILLVRGCLLAPVLLLWLASISALPMNAWQRANSRQPFKITDRVLTIASD